MKNCMFWPFGVCTFKHFFISFTSSSLCLHSNIRKQIRFSRRFVIYFIWLHFRQIQKSIKKHFIRLRIYLCLSSIHHYLAVATQNVQNDSWQILHNKNVKYDWKWCYCTLCSIQSQWFCSYCNGCFSICFYFFFSSYWRRWLNPHAMICMDAETLRHLKRTLNVQND